MLERDDSNCVVALDVLLQLLNSSNQAIQMATLNRYLKWYAASEVPLLIAVLSRYALDSLGEMRDSAGFRKALTTNVLTLFKAFHNPSEQNRTKLGEKSDWFWKWISGNTELRKDSLNEFKYHWIGATTDEGPLVAINTLSALKPRLSDH